jgi:large subunit ribosomal protein L25
MVTQRTQTVPDSTRKTADGANAPKATVNAMVGLEAKRREGVGKGQARRLRAAGSVPAVAYGRGLAATHLAVSPKDVISILKSERGQNSVIEMDLGEQAKLLLMIKDYSYHPVHRALEHVDFVQVRLDHPVDVHVPLVPIGKPAGVTAGGIIRQVYRTVPVNCVPDKIPLKIEVDISHLELNQHVSTQDLRLPPGVVVRLSAGQTLVAVVTPEKEREEAVPEPGAVAGAAVAGAAGAAPAAGAEAGKDAKAGAAAAPAKDAKKK